MQQWRTPMQCKHCNKIFNESKGWFANHVRWCDSNPKSQQFRKDNIERGKKLGKLRFGEYKRFEVSCFSCKSAFQVEERELLFPSKEKYFCSRNCANSIGGTTKANKYGYKGYRTIAEKYYKQQCAVCGVTDILDVHHIDENRENLHPSNLIFLCPNDHYRYHRNNDETVKKVIEGHGTAWGGHFFCKEEFSRVQIPDAPPDYFLKDR
jgi:hypothetical protein